MVAQTLVRALPLAWLQLADAGSVGSEGFVEIVWWDYFKVLLVLAALVAGAYALVRYAGPRVPHAAGGAGPVRVLGRYPLEPRKTLYLVRVGEQTLLVGAAEGSLSLLHTVPEGSIDLAAFERPKVSGAFLEKLRELQARK
ncbi:MAG: hypothetical protein GC160_00325 [Acidobacteria bacterium]|nr:hypothetical protein [Acidobacteriota bacterium]